MLKPFCVFQIPHRPINYVPPPQVYVCVSCPDGLGCVALSSFQQLHTLGRPKIGALFRSLPPPRILPNLCNFRIYCQRPPDPRHYNLGIWAAGITAKNDGRVRDCGSSLSLHRSPSLTILKFGSAAESGCSSGIAFLSP